MKTFLVLAAVLLGLSCKSQIDCEDLLQSKLPLTGMVSDEDLESFEEGVKELQNCGIIDSVDAMIIMSGPILGNLIVQSAANSQSLTYAELLEQIALIRELPEFPEQKRKMQEILAISRLPASMDTWEENKARLVDLQVPDSELQRIEEIIKNNKIPGLTYQDIFVMLENETSSINPPDAQLSAPNAENKWPLKNLNFEMARSLSREQNKALILYFTAYGSINALKMEQYVLSKPNISDRLRNEFIFVPLYVDDQAAAQSEGKTIGNINLELQLERFQNNSQPLFVKLDTSGLEIGRIGYIEIEAPFIEFLDRK